jgi:uncharacterized protein (DUF983 family)
MCYVDIKISAKCIAHRVHHCCRPYHQTFIQVESLDADSSCQRCGLESHDLDSSQTRVTNMMTCNSTLTPMTHDLTWTWALWLDLTWYPPQAQIWKMMLLKSVQRINSSFNRLQFESDSSQSICASWETVVRGRAEERPRLNSDGALVKGDAVSTKNRLQLTKYAGRKLQAEAQQFPTLFDIWSCTKNSKSWLI